MLRAAFVSVALLFSACAAAQSYSGSFTSKNNQGSIVTLAIKQDAKSNVTGTLLIAAQLEGTQLKVVLAEPLPNGQPNMAAARHLVFARSGGNQGRWKVQDSMLHLSQDGLNWAPQQLQVTQNSNGSPIVKSGGKEYMVCR